MDLEIGVVVEMGKKGAEEALLTLVPTKPVSFENSVPEEIREKFNFVHVGLSSYGIMLSLALLPDTPF